MRVVIAASSELPVASSADSRVAAVTAMDAEAGQAVVDPRGGFKSLLDGCLTDAAARGGSPEPEHSSVPGAVTQNYLVSAAAKAPWAGNGFRHFLDGRLAEGGGRGGALEPAHSSISGKELQSYTGAAGAKTLLAGNGFQHFLDGRLTGDRGLGDSRAPDQPPPTAAKQQNYVAVPIAVPVPAVATPLRMPILGLEPWASLAEMAAAPAQEVAAATTADLPCGPGSPPDPASLCGADTAGQLTWDMPVPQNDPDAHIEAAEDPRNATAAATPELAFGVRLLAPAPAAPSGPVEGLPWPAAGVPGNRHAQPDDSAISGTSYGALDDGQAASQNTVVAGNARSAFTATEEGKIPPAAERRDAAPPPLIAAKGESPSGGQPSGEHTAGDRGHAVPGGPADTESFWNTAPPLPSNRETESAAPAQEASTARPAEVEPPEPPAQPVSRDVSLHMAEGENSVDIRMAERAGEIRVTVHTPDRDLANSLRMDLPDLVGKLRQNGFQAEAWRPATPPDAGRRAGSDGSPRQDDSPDARKDGRQQQSQQRQPKDQSRWAGAWQSSLDPTQEFPT